MKLKSIKNLFFLGLLLTLLAACGGNDKESTFNSGKEQASGENVLNFVNEDIIPTMDPSMATDAYGLQFLGATMEGLYRLGENANLVEGIAINHEVSEDGLTYTFHLREDAKWSNGDPVTAHDFVYAWRRAVNPYTGSEYGPHMMGGVIKNANAVSSGDVPVEELGVTAEDDYTFVVELENVIPYFESLTTLGTFMPLNQAFVEEQGDRFATSSDTLLANGPYKLENWSSTASEWDIVKNDSYWDAEAVQIDRINHVVVKDATTQVRLYEEGTIDRASISSDLVDQYSTHEDYQVVPDTGVTYIKMNQTRSDALGNENIRAAISRAINKEALVSEILNNGSLVANGLVPVDFVNIPDTEDDFREVNGDLVLYDVKAAKEYWEKGLDELGTDTISIELLGTDSENAKVANEYIANQLSTTLPGLNVKLKNVPFEQRLDLDSNMDYDLQIAVWIPDYIDPNTLLDLWVTDGAKNKMGYSNSEYDRLIEEAGSTFASDNIQRYENFLEAEKILFNDSVIAPLYQKASAQLISPRVQGVYVNPFGGTYEYKWATVGTDE